MFKSIESVRSEEKNISVNSSNSSYGTVPVSSVSIELPVRNRSKKKPCAKVSCDRDKVMNVFGWGAVAFTAGALLFEIGYLIEYGNYQANLNSSDYDQQGELMTDITLSLLVALPFTGAYAFAFLWDKVCGKCCKKKGPDLESNSFSI